MITDRFPHSLPMERIAEFVGGASVLILEMGCNDGQDTLRFLRQFTDVELHCFEPDPRAIARFRATVADARCTLHEIAIGASDGTAILHMSGGEAGGTVDWDLSSSLHQPTGHLTAYPWCTFDRRCIVRTRSFDSWTEEHLRGRMIDFIWADIQGAEGDLIVGGGRCLSSRVRYLYTEFYDTPMYEGQISLAELLHMLPGYVCIGIYDDCNALLRNTRVK